MILKLNATHHQNAKFPIPHFFFQLNYEKTGFTILSLTTLPHYIIIIEYVFHGLGSFQYCNIFDQRKVSSQFYIIYSVVNAC